MYKVAQIFCYVIEVYRNGVVYVHFSEGGDPVGKLRVTQDLSTGYFDVYLPCDLQNETSPTFTDHGHNINNVVPLLSPSFSPDTLAFTNSPETIILSTLLSSQHLASQSPLPPTNKSKKRCTRLTEATRQKQLRDTDKNTV